MNDSATVKTSEQCARAVARRPMKNVPAISVASTPPSQERRATKASLVEDLLRREGGASLHKLCQASGWLPHSCRAFLTGLRKKGRAVEHIRRDNGITVYQIAATKAAA